MTNFMKSRIILLILFGLLLLVSASFAQEDYQIHTLLNSSHRSSGGYAALSNKFTTIKGDYANMVELYGGWYINHSFLLGVSGAAMTNNIPVPSEFSTDPDHEMSYEYGQFGLMTEYTLWSHRAIHLSFSAMNGAGFTVQYQRHKTDGDFNWDQENTHRDSNWFYVTEPGVRLEMNVFKWMRFSPGISYRAAFGSKATGLKDKDLSGTSLNLTLKFGKF
jgi:hypothetical protein